MKKLLSALCLCALLLCVVFAFSGCAEKGAAPTNLRLDQDTLTLEWRKVTGARAYEIRVSGDERIRTTQAAFFSLENLDPGSYVVEVRAIPADAEMEPSEWVSYNFVREEESGLRYKLINNRTEYEVVGAGTAMGDVVMEDVYRGKPVTSIAAKAFNNNKKITSLVIGSNVRTIGKNAFNRCAELVSITIPDSVTVIDAYAFQSCKKLQQITLPAQLQEIAPYMFSWCSALTEVKMGEQITKIGEYAFSNCSALQSIALGDCVESIGEYAFSDCTSLTSVDVGKNMQNVGEYAFFNCTGMTALELGENLHTLGTGAFGNCTSLTAVTLPESTVHIQEQCFLGCTALADVTIGTKLERIGVHAFRDTAIYDAAEDIFYLNGWAIANKDPDRTSLFLEEGTYGIADGAFIGLGEKVKVINFYGIKYVGASAFAGCNMWQVVFDDALLVLNESAFAACVFLNSVTVGNSLTTIGDACFMGCTRLLDMTLPASVTSIGGACFDQTMGYNNANDVVYFGDWAVGLKETLYFDHIFIKEGTRGIADHSFSNAMIVGVGVQLPSTLEIIGYAAFYNCSHVLGFGLSNNLRYIGDYAFYGCGSAWFGEGGITRIPDGVEYIGRSAFYRCSMMVGLYIPSSVKTIGDYAFYGCLNLGDSGMVYNSFEDMEAGAPSLKGDVIIAEGVEKIGERAFHSCSGIVEIVIPDSVTSIGSRAFYKCTKLQRVVLGEGIQELPAYLFYKCEGLTELKMSDSIRTIGDYAFRGCVELKNIQVGQSVEVIGNYAFYGCTQVSEIILPASVKSIGNYAFRGCAKVDAVILPATIEVIGKHAFYGLNKASFFCEAGTIPPYWNERWNSSYRAVFWGCVLSEDGSYVTSVVKGEETVENIDAPDGSLMAERVGYVLEGWSITPDSNAVTYTVQELPSAPDGTVLYAVWTPVNAEDEGEATYEETT